jgi:hypothetical protein
MIKRRAMRVLVPYSKTCYFVDRAVPRITPASVPDGPVT